MIEGLTGAGQQEAVLKLPWWRIYTTNYDNSVSTFRANFNARQVDNIFDLSDRAPRQLRPEAVIHLHGSIAKCDKANVDKS
jgi:NAD-dependent SIR2 family protein deacetylase